MRVVDRTLTMRPHGRGPIEIREQRFAPARTGEARWMTEGREGDYAAILAGAGFLFLLDDSAELIIAKSDGGAFEPLKKYSVADSATWAHPAVVGNRILIKDAGSLAMWSIE